MIYLNKTWFHIDLDAFFASVEQRNHPEYKGKPVVVGGLPGDRRAVVSTASYEAREYGIHSAMPLANAVKLCPNAIYIRGNYKVYGEVSKQIMQIFNSYSPTVIQISIDEAFIDMTGTEKLFGKAKDAALKIKNEIKEKLNLTVSIGISSSMYCAKIASGLKKPDGLTIVLDGEEEKFMLSLPIGKLWGVGNKTQEHLKSCGLFTNLDIYRQPLNFLITVFGESTGSFLYNSVRGNKDMIFGKEAKNHSISVERTFEYDLTEHYIIETALMELSQILIRRLYSENFRSRTVAVKIRYENFSTVSVQETSDLPVMNADDLFERSKKLFFKKYLDGKGIRLLGISLENLENKNLPFQTELFGSKNQKKAQLEKAIFELERKNPSVKIKKARLIEEEKNIQFHRDPND